MKTWIVLLGCLLAMASQAQTRREIWEWRDANGVTHFSDYPQPGARKIVINGSPATTTTRPTSSAAAAARPANTTQQVTEVTYTSLEIFSPENGASFFEPDVQISVQVRSDPEVGPTHRLLTYLDGKLLSGESSTTHTLSNVDRGVHSLTAVIVDRSGNELIRSSPVVFHMKQPSMSNPRNQGPAVRPPQPRGG